MKKGKTSKLNVFENAKCFYGTVDSKELKSIYIVIQSWVEPKKDALNWDRVAGNLKRQIQHNLLECVDLLTFDRNSIVDLDLGLNSTEGINLACASKTLISWGITAIMGTLVVLSI